MFQISFAGLTLDGVTRWEEQQPSRVAIDTFPRRHGAIVPETPFKGPKSGRFLFEVYADSESALLTYIESLRDALEGGRGDLTLRNDSRVLRAIKGNFGLVVDSTKRPADRAEGFIEFVAGDPFWYSSAGEQSASDLNIASSPHAFSAANGGGALTPARIEVKALVSNKTGTFRLTNTTTGIYSEYTGTINTDNFLIMNGVDSTVTVNGVNGLKDWSGSMWFLQPGTNNISYSGPTGVDVKIYWTERWH